MVGLMTTGQSQDELSPLPDHGRAIRDACNILNATHCIGRFDMTDDLNPQWERRFEVIDEECVGCNLCVSVCPVDSCITMQQVSDDNDAALAWTDHPNNPMRK